MLTLKLLKDMEPHEIIATGEIENSPSGVNMSHYRQGAMLRWVAKRGGIHDWAIYCLFADASTVEMVIREGDKILEKADILKLVEADEEAIKMYRH